MLCKGTADSEGRRGTSLETRGEAGVRGDEGASREGRSSGWEEDEERREWRETTFLSAFMLVLLSESEAGDKERTEPGFGARETSSPLQLGILTRDRQAPLLQHSVAVWICFLSLRIVRKRLCRSRAEARSGDEEMSAEGAHVGE